MPVMHKTLEFEIAFAVEDRSGDGAITKLPKQNEQFTHCFHLYITSPVTLVF